MRKGGGRMILYGLKTCDTCRNALKALDAAGHAPRFHDVRADGLDPARIDAWLATFGDALVNTRSTTWRGLSADDRAAPAAALLTRHPTLIKRPVIVDGDRATLGWTADTRTVWL